MAFRAPATTLLASDVIWIARMEVCLIDELGGLGFGQPHHIGVVVPNLDEAITDMAGVGDWIRLAVRQPPVPKGTFEIPLILETVNIALKAAFSRPGPVHFEMIEEVPGTIWSAAEGATLHHIAYSVPEERLIELSLDLEARGMPRESTRLNMAGTAIRAVYHRWQTGLRVELLTWGLLNSILVGQER